MQVKERGEDRRKKRSRNDTRWYMTTALTPRLSPASAFYGVHRIQRGYACRCTAVQSIHAYARAGITKHHAYTLEMTTRLCTMSSVDLESGGAGVMSPTIGPLTDQNIPRPDPYYLMDGHHSRTTTIFCRHSSLACCWAAVATVTRDREVERRVSRSTGEEGHRGVSDARLSSTRSVYLRLVSLCSLLLLGGIVAWDGDGDGSGAGCHVMPCYACVTSHHHPTRLTLPLLASATSRAICSATRPSLVRIGRVITSRLYV